MNDVAIGKKMYLVTRPATKFNLFLMGKKGY